MLPSGGGLPGYLEDMDSDFAQMEEDFRAKEHDPDIGVFARDWLPRIPRFRKAIRSMLADPDLLHPAIYEQSAQQYSQLYGVFNVLQSFLAPVIYNFSPRSRAVTKLTGALATEVGWTMGPSYENAGTQIGPATVAQLQGVFLPLYDYRKLTGLPATAHELGHILSNDPRSFQKLVGDWNLQISQHLRDEENAPVPLSQTFPHLNLLYRNWAQEFICDKVSTYLAGESFGLAWTHLATSMGGEIYGPAVSHPADDARIRGAAFVLEEMGDAAGAQAVRDLWDHTVPKNLSTMSPDYLRVFPDSLLRGLAKNVVKGCEQIGLTRYDSPQHHAGDMVDLIRRSSEMMIADPVGYKVWKRDTMIKLYKKLGVTGVGLDDSGGLAAA
jgi:hypothetical protein